GLRIWIVLIEKVEELSPKLEHAFLPDPERLVRGKIKIPNPRQAERVRSWRSSILPELRLHESGRIEPMLPGALIARQIAALSRNLIRPGGKARPRSLDVQSHRCGEAALRGHDRRHLPAIQQIAAGPVNPAEKRNVVENRLNETLRHVKSGDRSIAAHVV